MSVHHDYVGCIVVVKETAVDSEHAGRVGEVIQVTRTDLSPILTVKFLDADDETFICDYECVEVPS